MQIPASPPDRTVEGIGWMLLASFLFIGVTAIVRHVGSDLPAPEAAFIRYVFGVLFVLPAVPQLFSNPLGVQQWRLVTVRGVFHGIGVALWFYAMARIPIAEVTAIGYIAPIFVTIGAAIFLGERLQWRRVMAVVAAFSGTVIILWPGLRELSLGHGQIAQLCAAPVFAGSFLIAKRLTEDTSPTVIVLLLSVGCTLMLLPMAIYNWRDPTWAEVGWMGLTAAFATAGHYVQTRAFRCAPITVTQPIGFLQLVWATILGMSVFGEPLDPYVLVGGAVIVASATYISHREARVSRRQRTPPATATKM